MKLLITGGAGFIGSNIVSFFAKDTMYEITVIDNLKTGNMKNISDNVRFIHKDCSDESLLEIIRDKYDAIIHIAGQPSKEGSFNDVFYDLNSNAKSTLVLLELSKKIDCKRFIFISTVCIYGGSSNPGKYTEDSIVQFDSFYSIHKYTSEQYLELYKKHYNINYTIFRLFTCYGPGQDLSDSKKGMVSIYLSQFLNKETDTVIIKGSLDRYRDFIYVKDVVNIINESLLNINFYNQVLNLGTGKKTTIKDLLNLMNTIGKFNKQIKVEAEIIGDMIGCYSDNTKLLNIYNSLKFTSLENGIKEMIEFYTIN